MEGRATSRPLAFCKWLALQKRFCSGNLSVIELRRGTRCGGLNFLRRGCIGLDQRFRFRLGERLQRNFRHRCDNRYRDDNRLRDDFRRWLRNWRRRWCNRGYRVRFRDRGRFGFRDDERGWCLHSGRFRWHGCFHRDLHWFRNDDRFRLWSWRRLGFRCRRWFDRSLNRWNLCRLCWTFFWRANLR